VFVEKSMGRRDCNELLYKKCDQMNLDNYKDITLMTWWHCKESNRENRHGPDS
jgi:hypothetical protein